MSKKIALLIVLAAGLVLFSACNDDDECTTCPPPAGAPQPTMANIWPHADGTAWTYDIEYRELTPLPTVDVKEGEIPTMEELHAALQAPLEGEIVTEEDGLYRLAFDGMVTTESGAEGQNVVETFYTELYGEVKNSGQGGADPFFAAIARSRPDLREALITRCGFDEKYLETISPPMFMGGYAFSAEDEGYYSFGDLDQNHSWVYLEGDLSVGSEFSMQLVPMLADDIWLYGRIWSVQDRTIGGKLVENVLECMYLIDMGEAAVTDEGGNVIGTYYPYFYGVTFFGPEIGPLAGIERRINEPVGVLQDGPTSMFEYVMDGVGVTFPE